MKTVTPTELAIELWQPQDARLRRAAVAEIRRLAHEMYDSPGTQAAWRFNSTQVAEIKTRLEISGWAPGRDS